jgi:GTP cyclohydrolase I
MIIDGVGDDPTHDDICDSPKRVANTWVEFFKIDEKSDDEILFQKIYVQGYSNLVLAKNIQFKSFCEHHILPFFGDVSIAYLPSSESVVRLSK